MLQKGFFVMATNPPAPQPVTLHGNPEVHVKGVPSLFQMALWLVGTAIFIVGSILGGERFILSKSLEAMDARMSERSAKSESSLKQSIDNSVTRLNEDLTSQRRVVRQLVRASTVPKEQKEDLLKDLDLAQIRTAVGEIPKSKTRISVESLEKNKQIEMREVAKFAWDDGKREGQVRYFELLDQNLDLSGIDLYSDTCDSRVLSAPGAEPVVEVCQAHLNSEKGRLELIVVRNSE
jgi:hypothetical protein